MTLSIACMVLYISMIQLAEVPMRGWGFWIWTGALIGLIVAQLAAAAIRRELRKEQEEYQELWGKY